MLGIIFSTFAVILAVYGAYFLLTSLFCFRDFGKNKFTIGNHQPKHKFGILVAARNEEDVIHLLIDSIHKQNYPKELIEIFVIPNNCTDKTEEISAGLGATIIDCTTRACKSKGDAMDHAFKSLVGRTDIDAYINFDADNVVDKNFVRRMNDALCEGHVVAQGFRDAKNPKDNYLTGSYTIYFYLQNFFISTSRMYLRGSAAINGTGWMITKEAIDKYKYETTTMTDDLEFTSQCAINKLKIVFVKDAITYDEHVTTFKASWYQRRRWSTGALQNLRKYYFKLFWSFVKTRNIASLDLTLFFMAPIMQVVGIVTGIFFFVNGIILADFSSPNLLDILSAFHIGGILSGLLVGFLVNFFVCKCYGQRNGMVKAMLLFPWFTITWIPINLSCFFNKATKWHPIPHTTAVPIEKVQNGEK
ncbi:MAG: glycosyltransferase [Oscillospiraceae bacterium]|nr:glycosyltransferase [Oscillospiraceae bacterium]